MIIFQYRRESENGNLDANSQRLSVAKLAIDNKKNKKSVSPRGNRSSEGSKYEKA